MSRSESFAFCVEEKNRKSQQRFFRNLINSLESKQLSKKNKSRSKYRTDSSSSRCYRSDHRHQHIGENARYLHNDHHTFDRAVDWLALPFFAFLFFLVLASPELDRRWAKYIPHEQYRWLAKGLLFFVIIYILDRAIDQWRIDTFLE